MENLGLSHLEELKNRRKINWKNWYEKNKEEKRKYSREWRKNNSEKWKGYKKKWWKGYYQRTKEERKCKIKEWRKNNSEKWKGYCKSWWKDNPLKSREYKMKFRKENPEKYKAQSLARKIKMPKEQICQECRVELAKQKHHEDYSKPLEVKFVCRKCHNRLNTKRKGKENDKNSQV